MYNQEIKEKFLAEYTRNGASASGRRATFNELELFETRLAKDLAEMNTDEATDAVNSIEFYEYNSATTSFSFLKTYVLWCKNNGYFSESPYGLLELKADVIDPTITLSNILFKDEDEFIQYVERAYPMTDGYPESAAMLLAWEGVDLATSIYLTDEQVDLVNGRVFGRDGEVLVPLMSAKIKERLIMYDRLSSGMRENKQGAYPVIKDKSHNRFIKRFCSSSSVDLGVPLIHNNVKTQISRKNKKFRQDGISKELSATNAMRSGGLHRVYLLEQSGVDVFSAKNAAEVAAAFGGKPKEHYNTTWLYGYYKKAFSL